MLVTIRAQAAKDLDRAKRWYDAREENLGVEFVREARLALLRLLKEAPRFPRYHGAFRRVMLNRFPYKLFFIIEGDHIIIFRVLHAKQDHRRRLHKAD